MLSQVGGVEVEFIVEGASATLVPVLHAGLCGMRLCNDRSSFERSGRGGEVEEVEGVAVQWRLAQSLEHSRLENASPQFRPEVRSFTSGKPQQGVQRVEMIAR